MACADYVRSQNPWASQDRIHDILKILLRYGVHARAAIPSLRKSADYFENHETDFPKHLSRQKAAAVREAITAIEASTDDPQLRRIVP